MYNRITSCLLSHNVKVIFLIITKHSLNLFSLLPANYCNILLLKMNLPLKMSRNGLDQLFWPTGITACPLRTSTHCPLLSARAAVMKTRAKCAAQEELQSFSTSSLWEVAHQDEDSRTQASKLSHFHIKGAAGPQWLGFQLSMVLIQHYLCFQLHSNISILP